MLQRNDEQRVTTEQAGDTTRVVKWAVSVRPITLVFISSDALKTVRLLNNLGKVHETQEDR